MTKQPVSLSPRQRIDRDLREHYGWTRRRLSDREWSLWADEIDVFGIDEIARRVDQQWRSESEIEPTDDSSRLRMSDELSAFVHARSAVLAARANSDPVVEQFRDEHVGDPLLHPDDIPEWIVARAAEDGTPTHQVTITVPAGWMPGDPIPSDSRPGRRVLVLQYPDNGVMREQPVAAGGVLDRLRVIAELLHRAHGWQPAQAVGFVLTGHTPLVQMVTVRTADHWAAEHIATTGPMHLRQQVTIVADPDTPTELVTAIYTQTRDRLRGPRARLPRIGRSLLVMFAAHERRWFTLPEIRRRWNHHHGDEVERHPDQRQFRVALNNAERRVAGVPRSN